MRFGGEVGVVKVRCWEEIWGDCSSHPPRWEFDSVGDEDIANDGGGGTHSSRCSSHYHHCSHRYFYSSYLRKWCSHSSCWHQDGQIYASQILVLAWGYQDRRMSLGNFCFESNYSYPHIHCGRKKNNNIVSITQNMYISRRRISRTESNIHIIWFNYVNTLAWCSSAWVDDHCDRDVGDAHWGCGVDLFDCDSIAFHDFSGFAHFLGRRFLWFILFYSWVIVITNVL